MGKGHGGSSVGAAFIACDGGFSAKSSPKVIGWSGIGYNQYSG
ncbi:hypothetical protein EM6_2299 [Asticcacaulis excentricus]|uniref:Uncharacterized protein n=1 Tax=Asticcacaulis excentricus TaxID=78587 RepID=A0A3G9G4K8_9CAUL|nr:hypothetical protein EM6_2299 [Asticcacaulis excentricus]